MKNTVYNNNNTLFKKLLQKIDIGRYNLVFFGILVCYIISREISVDTLDIKIKILTNDERMNIYVVDNHMITHLLGDYIF